MYFSVLDGQLHINDGLIQPSLNAMSSMLTRIQAFPLKIFYTFCLAIKIFYSTYLNIMLSEAETCAPIFLFYQVGMFVYINYPPPFFVLL